jgi:hypothetical protein
MFIFWVAKRYTTETRKVNFGLVDKEGTRGVEEFGLAVFKKAEFSSGRGAFVAGWGSRRVKKPAAKGENLNSGRSFRAAFVGFGVSPRSGLLENPGAEKPGRACSIEEFGRYAIRSHK